MDVRLEYCNTNEDLWMRLLVDGIIRISQKSSNMEEDVLCFIGSVLMNEAYVAGFEDGNLNDYINFSYEEVELSEDEYFSNDFKENY